MRGIRKKEWPARFLLALSAVSFAAILAAGAAGLVHRAYASVSFFLGFLLGLTGTGGGALYTPMLIILGIGPTNAIGTTLLFSSIVQGIGSFQHHHQGTTHPRLFLHLTLASVPSSILGVATISLLKSAYGSSSETILARLLAIILIAGSILALARRRNHGSLKYGYSDIDLSPAKKGGAVILGGVVGFLVGLTSVGSGTLILIVLLLFYRLPAGTIVGTSMLNAAALQGAAGLGHLFVGNVLPDLLYSLLVGSIPGAIMGSWMVKRIPERVLRIIIIGAILASASSLLAKFGL